ncbi:MAG: winged helix-turn-helix transcriptional regulator, partial [Lachnospiraceae bacterium]|nr:winged helix-turn-helix transcriptional regulator [Lachnospiraceae bacterium]
KHEYNLIELLMKYPEKIYSKQELFEMAWDEYYIGEDKTINVHISNIRKKLAEITGKEYIDTVWGIGVRLKKQ